METGNTKEAETDELETVNREESMRNIPAKYAEKTDRAIEALVNVTASSARDEWYAQYWPSSEFSTKLVLS